MFSLYLKAPLAEQFWDRYCVLQFENSLICLTVSSTDLNGNETTADQTGTNYQEIASTTSY